MRHLIICFFAAALLISGCGSQKGPGLADFPESPSLYRSCVNFYEDILYKELDIYYVQPEVRKFFPDRESYYDFLDSILPAMRDRNFERNRILTYTILEMKIEDSSYARVKVHFTSDDILPFDKVMTVDHLWLKGYSGWYPGKIEAPKATRWDKLR